MKSGDLNHRRLGQGKWEYVAAYNNLYFQFLLFFIYATLFSCTTLQNTHTHIRPPFVRKHPPTFSQTPSLLNHFYSFHLTHFCCSILSQKMTTFKVSRVQTSPFEGQKPGTSGLRKKVLFLFPFFFLAFFNSWWISCNSLWLLIWMEMIPLRNATIRSIYFHMNMCACILVTSSAVKVFWYLNVLLLWRVACFIET